MKCPSCASTISGVYEAGDYTCSGCSAQLRINPVTRTKSKPKQSPHSQAQKRARKTARAGSMSGDEAGAYPSFKMRKDNPEGAHNRKFLAAASELGQVYGEFAGSMGRGRGKSALAKDLRLAQASELAGLEARLAIEEEKLERQEFSSARNAREHDKIRGQLIDRIDALIVAMKRWENPGQNPRGPRLDLQRAKIFGKAEYARKVASELGSDDDWEYRVVPDPYWLALTGQKGSGRAAIEIYDEDGEFVAYWTGDPETRGKLYDPVRGQNPESWRNPQPTITIEGQRFEVLYSLSLEEAKRMGRQLGGKVGKKTIARELILRKPKGKLIKAVALDDKGEIISRPYQPSLAGLPRDVIDRFLTLKAFKGPRRNPQQSSFGEEETRIATQTARGAGVIGATAVVPRWVEGNVPKSKKILDFGSGPPARHTMSLREKGYANVTAHEFGGNVQKGVHDPKALSKKYDVVFASNVLNVQSSKAMLKRTLKQICGSVKKDGLAVFNYPKEPRKAGLKVADVAGAIAEVFPGAVERVSQGSEAPMWTAKRS